MTRTRTPAKKATAKRAPRAPQDRKLKAIEAPEPQPITAEEFGIDTAKVLELLGVHPGMVIENSVHLSLISGTIVCEYQVRRAIPPRIMGMALLAGAAAAQQEEEAGEDDSSG